METKASGKEIKGIGTDIIEIKRIEKSVEKWGDRFLFRIFSSREIAYARSKQAFFASSLAARFAAKEAVLKALGTGLSGSNWQEIEITSYNGVPGVVLKGAVKARADALGIGRVHLSLSHCGEYALAFVVAEGEMQR